MLFTVQQMDDLRGRGVVALEDIPGGSAIHECRADIATLYSSFASHMCAYCYSETTNNKRPSAKGLKTRGYTCPTCDQFVLCSTCAKMLEVDAKTIHTDAIYNSLFMHAHKIACAWYCELPASVRASGQDTDYVRFCLHYGAYVHLEKARGSERRLTRSSSGNTVVEPAAKTVREHLCLLDTNAEAQSHEALNFCKIFARDRMVATFSRSSPPFPVSAEELTKVLLATRCNSLGFPFSDRETTGWSLEGTVMCMINHSCTPNAAMVFAENDDAFAESGPLSSSCSSSSSIRLHSPKQAGAIGLKALRDIEPGEEITISYVDLITLGNDVLGRTRHLLEQYRFLCACSRCLEQREKVRK